MVAFQISFESFLIDEFNAFQRSGENRGELSVKRTGTGLATNSSES